MNPTTLRNRLSGVIAFPVTPFKDDLSLDLPALHQNLTHLLQYPISALVAAGGTGELYSLTPAEYTRVIELTALAVDDRVPVIAGVGFGQGLAVEMAQTAENAGADGMVSIIAHELAGAIEAAAKTGIDEICVIGGGEIFLEFLPRASRIYLSEVDLAPVGDIFFPAIDPLGWREVSRESFEAGPRDEAGFTLRVLDRISPVNHG